MPREANQKPTILIADDSEINRAILADMLGGEYTVVEAQNGVEALARIGEVGSGLSLVLLDIVMPELDGFGVLEEMGRNRWIEDIPVIMISAETGAQAIERAYELGATDFISRPFDPLIVHKRVVNTIMLYAKQKQLVSMVMDQLFDRQGDAVSTDPAAVRAMAQSLFESRDVAVSQRTLQLLEQERVRHDFFASLSNEIQFEFTLFPLKVSLTPFGARKLGLPEEIADPLHDERVLALMGRDAIFQLSDLLRGSSPGQPQVELDCEIKVGGELRWHRLVARATWSADEPPRYQGSIGKAMDIHDSRMRLADLERIASTDPLTGLYNHTHARKQIEKRLRERPAGHFALAIFDMDFFKSANDRMGHLFGDHLLVYLAQKLRRAVRGGDIVARVGGDEFLLFMECKEDSQPAFKRIFPFLQGEFEGFPISLSMGIAETQVVGTDYDALFHAADNALYAVKRGGRGHYKFYDASMAEVLSLITPIAEAGDGG